MATLQAFFLLLHKEGLKLTFHPPCLWGQNPGFYTASKVDHPIKDPDVIVA
jgi:hypothetical protein